MRIDWVPFSASALVAGATALSVGALLMPASEDSGDSLRIVQEQGGQWMAVAGLYFFASVALTIGLPSVLTLFERRGSRTGLTALAVFTVGCVGIAGFAMLLAFFRALALNDSISAASLDEVTGDPGLAVFLYGWIGAFYLGELLLGIALLMAQTTPRWVPVLLLVHVALFPVSSLLPQSVQPLTALLITVALAGVGISANNRNAAVLVS